MNFLLQPLLPFFHYNFFLFLLLKNHCSLLIWKYLIQLQLEYNYCLIALNNIFFVKNLFFRLNHVWLYLILKLVLIFRYNFFVHRLILFLALIEIKFLPFLALIYLYIHQALLLFGNYIYFFCLFLIWFLILIYTLVMRLFGSLSLLIYFVMRLLFEMVFLFYKYYFLLLGFLFGFCLCLDAPFETLNFF